MGGLIGKQPGCCGATTIVTTACGAFECPEQLRLSVNGYTTGTFGGCDPTTSCASLNADYVLNVQGTPCTDCNRAVNITNPCTNLFEAGYFSAYAIYFASGAGSASAGLASVVSTNCPDASVADRFTFTSSDCQSVQSATTGQVVAGGTPYCATSDVTMTLTPI